MELNSPTHNSPKGQTDRNWAGKEDGGILTLAAIERKLEVKNNAGWRWRLERKGSGKLGEREKLGVQFSDTLLRREAA